MLPIAPTFSATHQEIIVKENTKNALYLERFFLMGYYSFELTSVQLF